jgi:plastocyanin
MDNSEQTPNPQTPADPVAPATPQTTPAAPAASPQPEKPKQKNKFILPALIVVLIIAIGYSAVKILFRNHNVIIPPVNTTTTQTSQKESTPTPLSQMPSITQLVPTSSDPSTSKPDPNFQEVNITAKNGTFTPNVVTTTVGKNVAFTIVNQDKDPINFVIEGLDIKTDNLELGDSKGVSVVMDKKGSYEFHSTIGTNQYKGTLIVN